MCTYNVVKRQWACFEDSRYDPDTKYGFVTLYEENATVPGFSMNFMAMVVTYVVVPETPPPSPPPLPPPPPPPTTTTPAPTTPPNDVLPIVILSLVVLVIVILIAFIFTRGRGGGGRNKVAPVPTATIPGYVQGIPVPVPGPGARTVPYAMPAATTPGNVQAQRAAPGIGALFQSAGLQIRHKHVDAAYGYEGLHTRSNLARRF